VPGRVEYGARVEATAKRMGSGVDQIPKEGMPAAPVSTARLFFALWPDDLARADLARAVYEAARSCGGRPVPEHNLHATLVFLGSVAASRLTELRTIGTQVASSNAGAPLRLDFDRVEHWQKPGVLVASATTSAGVAAASALARALLEATHRVGFDPDSKPFRPHVTIARKVGKQIRVPEMPAVSLAFDSFALVESRTGPEGPVYTVMEAFPLS
jgi:2'-5' RNA ligase